MFEFRAGSKPVFVASAFAALVLGGCSSNKTAQYTAENVAVAEPQTVAHAPRTDVEGDGLPAQTPPVQRVHQEPDDPSEPYSRNYGGVNPSLKPLAKPETEKPAPQRVPVPQQVTDNSQPRKYWRTVAVVREAE